MWTDRDGAGTRCEAGLFRKVESFSQSEVGRFGTPSLITRNTNDVQQVQTLMGFPFDNALFADDGDRRRHHGAPQDVPLSISLPHLPIMVVFLFLVLRKAIPCSEPCSPAGRINLTMRENLKRCPVMPGFCPAADYEETFYGNRELTNHREPRSGSSRSCSLFAHHHEAVDGRHHVVGGHRVDSGGPIGNLLLSSPT